MPVTTILRSACSQVPGEPHPGPHHAGAVGADELEAAGSGVHGDGHDLAGTEAPSGDTERGAWCGFDVVEVDLTTDPLAASVAAHDAPQREPDVPLEDADGLEHGRQVPMTGRGSPASVFTARVVAFTAASVLGSRSVSPVAEIIGSSRRRGSLVTGVLAPRRAGWLRCDRSPGAREHLRPRAGGRRVSTPGTGRRCRRFLVLNVPEIPPRHRSRAARSRSGCRPC